MICGVQGSRLSVSFVEPAGDALIQTLTSELFFSAQGAGFCPHWVVKSRTAKRHLSGVWISGTHFSRRKHHYTDNQWFYSCLLVLSSHRSSSLLLQHDSIADLKLKFDRVFTEADYFPDFFSALICSLSVFQRVKTYLDSLMATGHDSGPQELGNCASGRVSDQQAECCHCPRCSFHPHACCYLMCMASLYHMDQMVQKLQLADLGPKDTWDVTASGRPTRMFVQCEQPVQVPGMSTFPSIPSGISAQVLVIPTAAWSVRSMQ